MTATIVTITRRGAKPPRAVQIPEQLTDDDIDDTLYGFGFEYFGDDYGTQRLVAIDDDSVDDYGNAADVMRAANVPLALYDRNEHEWAALHPGDWVVEPQDDRGDGFVRMTDEAFRAEYEVTQ